MEQQKKNKPFLTLFIISAFSLLIAMTSAIQQILVRIGFQAVLILIQIVIVKAFLDDYYGETY